MKKIITVIAIVLLTQFSFSQEENLAPSDAIKFSYLDGTPIKMDKIFNSVNDVFNKHFAKYILHGTELDKVEGQGNYEIVYQKFSYKPLFLVGEVTEENKEDLKEVLEKFNEKYNYRKLNIDRNTMIEYDIKDAIELKLVDTFF